MEEKNHHEHDLNAAFSKGKKKLSLESYFSVLASGDYNVLTIRELNQIISIHGFKHLHKRKKIELVEAVRTIELKNFSRSTLCESIQPAPMSLTDVIKDLTQLNWQTCPVVSVRSIDSTHYNNTAPTCNPKASVDPTGLKSEKKKKKKKTGSASNQKNCDQSGRSGEQACSVVNESSTCNPMAIVAPNNLITALKDVPASKQNSFVQSGVIASSGGDNSGDQKEYGAVMIGTSCSSSTMAEEIPKPENKRKRKLNKKSLEDLLSRSI